MGNRLYHAVHNGFHLALDYLLDVIVGLFL
jgi:hypothetical protein